MLLTLLVGVIFIEMYGVLKFPRFLAKISTYGPYVLFTFILMATPVCIRRYGLRITALALGAWVLVIGFIKLLVFGIHAISALVS